MPSYMQSEKRGEAHIPIKGGREKRPFVVIAVSYEINSHSMQCTVASPGTAQPQLSHRPSQP